MLISWSSCFVCDCSQGFSERMRQQDLVDLPSFDPEPERTLHRTHREQRTKQTRNLANMENNEEQVLALSKMSHIGVEMGIMEGIKHLGCLYSQMIHSCC